MRAQDTGRGWLGRTACVLVADAVGLAGCGQGDGSGAGGAPSSRLVDLTKPPPLVNTRDEGRTWDEAFVP